MKAYQDYLEGKLVGYAYPEEQIKASIGRLREAYPWLDQLPY